MVKYKNLVMKNIQNLIIIPILISLFSFVPNISNQDQKEEYKLVWLISEDWKALEKISTKGKNTTAVVDIKTRSNIVHKVQYRSTDVNFTKAQREKLEEILKKYE